MKTSIPKYIFKKGGNFKIEVVPLAPLVARNKEYINKPHRTDFYHIFIFKDCNPAHLLDFNAINIEPYSLLFIDKDRVHQFDPQANYEGLVLIFTDDFYCITEQDLKFLKSTILFNDLTDSPAIRLGETALVPFLQIADSINRELQLPGDNLQHHLLKNLLHNFLLLAEREKRKTGYGEIKKGADFDHSLLFKNLLETEFVRNRNVSHYAARLNISEKRLNLATSKVLGKAPKELIDERVVLEAKRLIVHSNQSIKEIGFELGFDEPTNFIKYFRKHAAMTPIEFRQQHLA